MLPMNDLLTWMAYTYALHVIPNAGGDRRVCVDATQSELNAGTDMDAMAEYLGEHTMPTSQDVARMV